MTESVKEETIKNERIISGILKEAQFFENSVEIIYKGEKYHTIVSEIKEDSHRQANTEKKLFLEKPVNFKCVQNEIIEINIHFDIYFITFTTKLCSISENGVSIFMPAEISILERRNNLRLDFEPLANNVLIKKEEVFVEGWLEIFNSSANGYGGKLKLAMDQTPSIGDQITGKIHFNSNYIDIDLLITRIELISDSEYAVGLKQSQSSCASRDGLKRKRNYRLETNRPVQLTNIIFPERHIELQMQDISVSGFSCRKIQDKEHDAVFFTGAICIIEGTSLRSQVYQVTEDLLRFKIIEGSNEDRLEWFTKFSTKISNSKNANLNALELIKIFCESGVVSSQYINSNKHKSRKFKSALQSNEHDKGWIQRWISTDDHSKTNGHICGIRIADNNWLIGDFAGSQDIRNRIDSDFAKNFFKSFSEWSLSLSPSPVQLFMWLENHPYWKNYENYILNNKLSNIHLLETNFLGYSRPDNLTTFTDSMNVKIDEIKPTNHSLINNMLDRAKSYGTSHMLNSLDFSIYNFGSPQLKKFFKKKNLKFHRKYFNLRAFQKDYVIILNIFPEGSSINRVTDSIWIIQLDDHKLNEAQWLEIINSVMLKSLQYGLKAPSIRRIFQKTSDNYKYNTEQVILRYLVASPLFWLKAQEEIE